MGHEDRHGAEGPEVGTEFLGTDHGNVASACQLLKAGAQVRGVDVAELVIAILVVEDRALFAEPPEQRRCHREAEPTQQWTVKFEPALRPADLGNERDALEVAPDPSTWRYRDRPQDVQTGFDGP
jgi:hypothetical protein